jgi:mRNA interferase RelE/StbE
MRYTVRFTPAAERAFRELPSEAQSRLLPLIERLATEPRPAPPLGKKLAGEEHTYRLAVGSFRVIYEVHKGELLVLVVWAGRRRDAYRRR